MSRTVDVHHHVIPDFYWEASNEHGNAAGGITPPRWSLDGAIAYLDEARIDVIERRLMEAGAPDAVVQLRVLGGEMARVPADDAAFGWRDRPVLLWLSVWDPELGRAAANDAWNAAFRAELAGPGAASYVNFMGAEEADAARGAYPAPAYARLRELKRRFDPDSVFRANHNIPPA